MGDFAVGRAIGAGFRLIGREPLAFLAWAVMFLLVAVLPQMAAFAMIAPAWTDLVREASAAGSAHSTLPPGEIFRLQATMMQAQPVSLLGTILGHTLLLGAVYRAVLYPEDRGFLYLRFSSRELWLGLAMLVLVVMYFLALLGAMLPAGILLGLIAALSQGSPGAAWLALPVILAVLGVVIWLMLRLSLATPMSFAERHFRLYESWSLTSGHAGKMFLVVLALAVIGWLTEIVLASVALAAFGGLSGLERLSAWLQSRPHLDLPQIMPWLAGFGIVVGLLSAALGTLFAAAWAEIYRDLAAGVEPTPGVAR